MTTNNDDTLVASENFLLRTIREVEHLPDAVLLHVTSVSYHPIGRVAGIITTEPASSQGLESLLPNAPKLDDPSDEKTDKTVKSEAILVVRGYNDNTLRLTMLPGSTWPTDPDKADPGEKGYGILVEESLNPLPLATKESGESVEISTGALTLVFDKFPFGFKLLDQNGRRIALSGGARRQVAGFPFAGAMDFGLNRSGFSLELQPGEKIIGLGEQFSSVNHIGRKFELIANDALGVGTGLVYKPAPVWHSSKGYSAFLHGPGPMSVSVGTPYPSLLQVENELDNLDLFLIAGEGLKERLTHYSELTGRMNVPPRWALGVWMSRCRYANREELEAAAKGMREHRVPCDVLHIDPDWLVLDRLNCDFIWSEEKYPAPKEMFASLLEDGFHASVWELPYLDEASPLSEYAKEMGYLVRSSDNEPALVDRTFSRDGRARYLVDFSNPDARKWWGEKNEELLDLGASVLKCDFGEGLPDSASMSDGLSGRNWRNLYPLWYSRTVHETVAKKTQREPLVWSRSGWAGSQRYPAQWGGDPEASFAGLAASLRGGLGWAVSAPGMWSHDIGGFYGMGPSKELFIRWSQIGCLSPLTRFHGLTPREPWVFGEEVLGIVRDYVELRYRLLPYLMSAAKQGSLFGWPMLRPLTFEDPTDITLYDVEHEFLLGPDLLIVAVLDETTPLAEVEIVLPKGSWSDFWTGEAHVGPKRFTAKVPLDKMPIFVRSGGAIPFGEMGQHTMEIPDDKWSISIWPGPDTTTTIYQGENEFRYRYNSQRGVLLADEPKRRITRAEVHSEDGRVAEVEIEYVSLSEA